MRSIKAVLGKMVKSKAWLELPKVELLEVVEDPSLKVIIKSTVIISSSALNVVPNKGD